MTISLHQRDNNPNRYQLKKESLNCFQLLPSSHAKPQPDYIPEEIRNSYYEACSIVTLSPKASAAMSRRCLQGMIRDYWQEKLADKKLPNLRSEINAIKDFVDPLTWEAIDTVRGLGNIGAHMEKDVNMIIDIDEGEAQQLIGLNEYLFQDWYVSRYNKQQRLQSLIDVGALKSERKKLLTHQT